jgi:hypothetical protein
MAANTNKRIPVKWIRDKAKSAYVKDEKCFICGTTHELELHHTHSITQLFQKWCSDNGYNINSDDEILDVRDDFIEIFHKEIYEEVYTLCLKHHQKLHSVYGKAPALSTAEKQATWIHKQKDRLNGLDSPEPENVVSAKTGNEGFGKFLRGKTKSSSVYDQYWVRDDASVVVHSTI